MEIAIAIAVWLFWLLALFGGPLLAAWSAWKGK
jgi:hypothetical protein